MAAQPLFVSSGDLVADRRYQWALDYLQRGDAAAAADILTQVVETAPGFATAWFALGLDPRGDWATATAPSPRSRRRATPTARTITARGCIWPASASARRRRR